MRWFLSNLGILLAIDWLAACVYVVPYGDLRSPLGYALGTPLLGLFCVGETLAVTLPGFLLYLGGLSRRRSRRAAWVLSPLLVGATWWTVVDWPVLLPVLAFGSIPVAAALVRV